MLKLSLLIFLIFVLVYVYFYCAKLSVLKKRYEAEEAFKVVDKELKERYNILLELLNRIIDAQYLTNDISRLRNEVILLGTKRENIDRRIALDTDLAVKTKELILKSEYNTREDLIPFINKYKEHGEKVLQVVKEYNLKANFLRCAVSVFPWSFVSRLNNIKYFDSFRV